MGFKNISTETFAKKAAGKAFNELKKGVIQGVLNGSEDESVEENVEKGIKDSAGNAAAAAGDYAKEVALNTVTQKIGKEILAGLAAVQVIAGLFYVATGSLLALFLMILNTGVAIVLKGYVNSNGGNNHRWEYLKSWNRFLFVADIVVIVLALITHVAVF